MPARKRITPDPQLGAQRLKLAEEFAILDKEVETFKLKLFRHEKLRRLILDWYPSLPPDQEAIVRATTCDILITSRDPLRTVTLKGKRKLFLEWGQAEFIAKCTLYLKHLPDPKDELGLYSESTLSGPRHLHVVAKGAKAVAAAPAA